MKASTVEILARVNRDFYQNHAAEFSGTRKRSWPGWTRLFDLALERFEETLDPTRLAIVDLGCGNGRLLPELERSFGERFSYLGVDASIPLVARAARACGRGGRTSFLAADLVDEPMSELRPTSGFDLIVAFGLMHHVPSSERRRALLAAGVEHLRPHGLLAVSFWQFGELERFRRRFLPWDGLPASAGRLDSGDLEDGDHLLAWGNSGAARYCHYSSPAEAEELIRSAGGRSALSFRADGESQQLNLYHLVERVA